MGKGLALYEVARLLNPTHSVDNDVSVFATGPSYVHPTEEIVTVRPTVPIICPDDYKSCDLHMILGVERFVDFSKLATSNCVLHFTGSEWDRTKTFGLTAVQNHITTGNKRLFFLLTPNRNYSNLPQTPVEWLFHPPVTIEVSIDGTLPSAIFYSRVN